MAAAADKARFYLESSVTELREWERRELFSRDEIASVTAKRSAFEHSLNARGAATPGEWARYITYEMNLDALRRKRVTRKKMKATAQGHAAQQRIFLLLDRATKRFPGNLELWFQYIEYARKQRANKKVSRILTDVLRLHPTTDHMWIYAAKWSIDVQGDMEAARGFFQRGLRFCKLSKPLYLEYARLELGYVAKIGARQKILGMHSQGVTQPETQTLEENINADVIVLPAITAGDFDVDISSRYDIIESTLEKLSSSPALNGAIPLAIFNAAMGLFRNEETLGEEFFNMFSDFGSIPCVPKLVDHVANTMLSANPQSIIAMSCQCRLPLVGIPVNSHHFPLALGTMLKSVKSSMVVASGHEFDLGQKLLSWLVPLAETKDLAPELQRVLSATVRRLAKQVEDHTAGG